MTGGWSDLVATALLGTERRPVLPAQVAGTVDVTTADDARAQDRWTMEGLLLAAAALIGAARRAGWVPPRGPAPPPPAPDDPAPVASSTAVQVLELLLQGAVTVPGGPEPIVDEWLLRCGRSGRRLPTRLLTTVLERATQAVELRPAAAAAIGERGRWLAGQNPAWAWAAAATAPVHSGAAGDDLEQRWAVGSRPERLELLRAVRAVDPSLGRDLLGSTFASEAAADRAAFLRCLDIGLGDGDEPLLDEVLDDRSAAVRAAAAGLLDRLPASRRAARMAERSVPLVRITGRVRRKLEVDLPEEPDAAARRDGIVDADRGERGRRAWWLVQLVAATPLRAWASHLGRSPADLVSLAAGQRELLEGWSEAAVAQGDVEWAEALLAVRPAAGELLTVMSPPDAARALAGVLAAHPSLGGPRFAALLDACPRPWTAGLSRTVLDRVRTAAAKQPVGPTHLVPVLAAALDPGVAGDVERWIGKLDETDPLRRHVRRLHHALTLRQTIAEELS